MGISLNMEEVEEEGQTSGHSAHICTYDHLEMGLCVLVYADWERLVI